VVAGFLWFPPGAGDALKAAFLERLPARESAVSEKQQAAPLETAEKQAATAVTASAGKSEAARGAAAIPASKTAEPAAKAAAAPAAKSVEIAAKAATAPAAGKPETAGKAAASAPQKAEIAAKVPAAPAPAKAEIVQAEAAPPPPKKAAAAGIAGIAPPEQLGQLQIRRGGTVLGLLQEIYGSTETERFRAVIRANPHIKDMNWVIAGETIHFPAIRGRGNPLEPGKTWVRVAQAKTLAEAYRAFKDYPNGGPPIRLIPAWNPREGLTFTIVLRQGFENAEVAGRAIRSLPYALAGGAGILEKPDENTVYFTR
jgi:hypothetical protein